VVRCCVWSRNLKNEEATIRVGSQRHRGETDNNKITLDSGCIVDIEREGETEREKEKQREREMFCLLMSVTKTT